MRIISYDIISPKLTTMRIFDFSDDFKSSSQGKHSLLKDNLRDLEIETINSILNVGGLFNVILAMIGKILIIIIFNFLLKVL
jgi:hypothetical protein